MPSGFLLTYYLIRTSLSARQAYVGCLLNLVTRKTSYYMNSYLTIRVKQLIPEAKDAVTLVLEPVDKTPVAYKAGQFLTFLLHLNGREVRRSYSLSSSPATDKHLAVTIKRVENGEVSRYLLDHLREGDELQSLYPAGRFTIPTHPDNQRDIFLIGAGSGVTPLFSLLKTIVAEEPRSRVVLINSNRNETTALFWQPLQQLAKRYPEQLSIIHLFSDPLPQSGKYPKRLTIGLLRQLVNEQLRFNRHEAQFYVCGPHPFMRMAKMALTFMEFDQEQVHQEYFVTETLPAPTVTLTDTSPKNVTIVYRNQPHTLQVPANQFILNAALQAGIQLPYSCRGGRCSTCASRCTQGEVHMLINDVLTDKDVAEGWVLTCVAYPVTDEVRIEVG